MIVRFIIPNEQAEKMNGFLGCQIQKMMLRNGSIYEKNGLVFSSIGFRMTRDNFGAVLVAADRIKVCEALGLSGEEPGIIQGLTETEYANKIKKSRQFINKMVKTGKLDAVKVGRINIVKTEGAT